MHSRIFFLLLVSMTICVSCSNRMEEQVIGDSRNIQSLLQNIDSINLHFLREYNITNEYTFPRRTMIWDDNPEPVNGISVVEADGIGFASGLLFGTLEGVLIGTVICPGFGSVAGAVADGLTAGIAVGLVSSISVARDIYVTSTQNTESYWEFADCVNYGSDVLFNDDIKGANIGWYHNVIIQEMWDNSIDNYTVDFLMEYVSMYFENNGICEFESRENFYQSLTDNWSYRSDYFDMMNPDYQQIIEEYLATMWQLSESDRFSYTETIMEKIAGYGLPDEDVYLLNGTISTSYYSSLLWNMDAVHNVHNEN